MGNRNFNLTSQKADKDWFEPVLNIHIPFSPSLTPIFFYFYPLKLSSQKNYSRVEKILEGHLAQPPKLRQCSQLFFKDLS